MVWVKICGTTSLEDACAAVEAGADALGFVFAPSPRRVEPDQVREIVAVVPAAVEKVGVFVNTPAEHIREVADYAGLTAIQLHGDEDVSLVEELAGTRNASALARWKVIKAVAVRGGFGAQVAAYGKCGAHAVLLDTAGTRRGGSGQPFDWRAVAEYMPRHALGVRVIVAGGLNPDNVAEPLRMIHPWGVDVVSGVEREPGKKDPQKMRDFVKAARNL
jgi:phosphoribosylanthranilate isomerase